MLGMLLATVRASAGFIERRGSAHAFNPISPPDMRECDAARVRARRVAQIARVAAPAASFPFFSTPRSS